MIIAVYFPIYATGKKKPEKIRASTGFEPVTSANTGAMPPMCGFIAQFTEIGPLQLGSRDQIFPRKCLYYGL